MKDLDKNNYEEIISRTNEIFTNFFPSVGQLPSDIKMPHVHFACVIMHEAVEASKKYGATMELMKEIPNAIPPNVGLKWLLALGRKAIWAYYKNNDKIYKAVRDTMESSFRHHYWAVLNYNDDPSPVREFLSKYNSFLGENY